MNADTVYQPISYRRLSLHMIF